MLSEKAKAAISGVMVELLAERDQVDRTIEALRLLVKDAPPTDPPAHKDAKPAPGRIVQSKAFTLRGWADRHAAKLKGQGLKPSVQPHEGGWLVTVTA